MSKMVMLSTNKSQAKQLFLLMNWLEKAFLMFYDFLST
jgi:hypothetical protein